LFDGASLVTMLKKKANWMQQQRCIDKLKLDRHVSSTFLPIFRSIRLCNTVYGMLYPNNLRWVIWWSPSPDHPPATYLGTTYHKLYYTV